MELTNVIGYAHRGLHNIEHSVIENSETAIRDAIRAGVGIEIDVQMSGDRVPMVFHDETLSRLTGQDGRMSFMKAGVLTQIPYTRGQDRILSLKECLDLVDGQVPLLIEVKSHWTDRDEMEQGIIDAISDYKGTYGIMSFDPSIIRRLKAKGFQGQCGLVTSQCPPKDWPQITEDQRLQGRVQFDAARELKIDFLAHEIGDITNPHLQATLRALGIPLFTWTVRTEAQTVQAKNMNAVPIFEAIDHKSLTTVLAAHSHS